MMSNNRYLIDFWGGSHGHFLEYVVNCWIFDCHRVSNLFTNTGACHGARADERYMQSSFLRCGHFSEFDLDVDPPDKVIRISVDGFSGYCCYQINIIHRAGDIPKEHKELFVPIEIRQNTAALRMDYYSKFMFSEYGSSLPANWKFQDKPGLTVSMTALYDFVSFMQMLRSISDFLKFTFRPDRELVNLWQQFMQLNQGWTSWVLCNDIMKDIIAGNDRIIDLEVDQQALLNALLSKTCNLYDEVLFTSPEYPINTKHIHQIVTEHVMSFDSKFPDID